MSRADTGTAAPIATSRHGHVAVLEICRPPHNHFDIPMIQTIADGFEAREADDDCRAIVRCSQGPSFCAGADFANREAAPEPRSLRAVNPIDDTWSRRCARRSRRRASTRTCSSAPRTSRKA